jgi:hypothetical protein
MYFQNQISQSWRVRFACLNSRSTSTNPNLSNGSFKLAFGAQESSQIVTSRSGALRTLII